MKNSKTQLKSVLKKYRVRNGSGEIFYTYTNWEPNEIDGVTFLPVVKSMPSQSKTQQLHYLRKDSLEAVK
jgi:hypothetical protein